MIKEFLSRFNEEQQVRDERKFSRLPEEFAQILINGSEYNVKDWSRGGVYFKAPGHSLAVGDHLNFTLKFELPHEKVLVPHSGRIIRQHHDGFALAYDPQTIKSQKNFNRIMDGVISRGLADSVLNGIE